MTKSCHAHIRFNIYITVEIYVNGNLNFYYHVYCEISKLMKGIVINRKLRAKCTLSII